MARFAFIVVLFAFALAAHGADVDILLRRSAGPREKPEDQHFKLIFEKKGRKAPARVVRVTDAVRNPLNYVLAVHQTGKSAVPITIESVEPNDEQLASILTLKLKKGEKLPATFDYVSCRIFSNTLDLGGLSFAYRDGADGARYSMERESINEEYLSRTAALERSFGLKTGTAGGVTSLRWFWIGRDAPTERGKGWDWNYDAQAKAEVTLPKRERDDWLNQIQFESNLFVNNQWGGNRADGTTDPFRLYLEAGVRGAVESDQSFDNVDGVYGVQTLVVIGNPLTDTLYKLFQPKDEVTITLSPVLRAGYQRVVHLEQEREIDTGEDRLDLGLFWRWPLLRRITLLQNIGLVNDIYDGDLVLDVGGKYDLERGTFYDLTQITLDFTPRANPGKYPTLTFTYAQGRAAPTFENFDAFLAGFKFKFW